MSEFYAVVTVGDGDDVRRASRAGDGFAVADISTENQTFRVEVKGDDITLKRVKKRWSSASATPASDWDCLYTASL